MIYSASKDKYPQSSGPVFNSYDNGTIEGRDKKDLCKDAIVAAKGMAEKYAQNAGEFLGCMDGFNKGLNVGYGPKGAEKDNPTDEMLADENITNTVNYAIQLGNRDALALQNRESANTIINKYRDVVGKRDNGQQVLPELNAENDYVEASVNLPENGYFLNKQKEEGGSLQNASSHYSKVQRNKANQLNGAYTNNLCNINKTQFGRTTNTPMTIWEYFRLRNEQHVQAYHWNDGHAVLNEYKHGNDNLDGFLLYKGIATKTKTVHHVEPNMVEVNVRVNGAFVPVMETISSTDANGVVTTEEVPKKDAQGNIIYQTEMIQDGVNEWDEYNVALSAAEKASLKSIFEENFKVAYEKKYANEYFGIKYNVEGLKSQTVGEIIGQEIALEVARAKAKVRSYNTKFKADYNGEFKRVAKKTYVDSYNELVNIFKNNPVVEFNAMKIYGTNDDAIFRRNEELTADISVTNLGEVSRDITLRLNSRSGEIVANNQGFTFSPTELAVTSTETSVLGKIAQNAPLRRVLNVRMSLDNPNELDEVGSELEVTKGENAIIREYAELGKRQSGKIEPLDGKFSINLDIVNPSNKTIDSEDIGLQPNLVVADVVFKLDNGSEITKSLVTLDGTTPVAATFEGLDPKHLIDTKVVRGTVEVRLGSTTVESRSFAYNVDANISYADYFTKLAIEGSTKNETEAVLLKLDSLLDDALDRRTIWRNQSEVNNTIIGDLQDAYQAAKDTGKLTPAVQAKFDIVALTMAKKMFERGTSRVRGGIGDRHYIIALRKISEKLPKKKRHIKKLI